jgi:hypothetical protein
MSEWMDPQNIIAICTGIVAGLAFAFSLIALYEQAKHDKLSVRPLGYFNVFDSEKEIKIEICNRGTGPMIFKSIQLLDKADKPVENDQDNKSIKDANGELIKDKKFIYPFFYLNKLNQKCVFHLEPKEKDSLINGPETIVLLSFKPEDPKIQQTREVQRENIRSALSEFKIKMEYTDIYGEFFTSTEDLSYFKREIKKCEYTEEERKQILEERDKNMKILKKT